MQHRMEVGLRKYIGNDIQSINYAVYSTNIIVENAEMADEQEILERCIK